MIVKNGLLGKRGNVVTIEATADLATAVKLLADDASARLARSDRCQLILGNQLRIWTGGFVMKVGFVGLGHMGSGMAASLLKAGHEVIVYNRTRAKAEPLIARGARVVASVADACRESVVITMLANDAAVEGLVLGKGGVIDSLPKGGIHISSSTISVALSGELAKAHAKAGQRFVAAPVFGRPDVAAAGQLFVITAGPQTRSLRHHTTSREGVNQVAVFCDRLSCAHRPSGRKS